MLLATRIPLTGVIQEDPKTGKSNDPRGPIAVKAKELGLSPEIVARIRKTCGYVFCGEPTPWVERGGGCLAGRSGMQVLTAHHVLFKYLGTRLRADQCYFQNQDARVELDLAKIERVSGERTL